MDIRNVSVKELLFDTENPRFPQGVKGKPDEYIIKWMLENASIIELMSSISEKDYFPGEPLLVVKKEDKYEVVEGNRRLTALILLNDPALATVKKQSVNVIYNNAIFKPDIVPVIEFSDRNDIVKYLGFRHITGIEEWGPLAKARYLNLLREPIKELQVNVQYRKLALSIGSNSNYVKRLLTGYTIYTIISEEEAFFNIKGLDETTISFSLITTALNYSNINSYLGVDYDLENPAENIKRKDLKNLTKWIFEKGIDGKTRLGESRNLRVLNSVLNVPKALKKFEEGISLKESALFTGEPAEIFRKSIREAFQMLSYAKENSTWVENLNETDLQQIDTIIKISRELKVLVDSILNPEAE